MPAPAPRRRAPLPVALVALAVAVAIVGAACGDDRDAAPPPTTLRPADEVDVAYGPATGCGTDGEDDEPCGGSQELDIWRSPVAGPNPVMLWLHGGGGIAGDKSVEVPEDLQAFLDDGWDVVGVNYRLATEDGDQRFPAALLDAKRAVRWVKANAAGQDWDPTRVAAVGHSLGGNLVQLLATTSGDPALEPTDLPAELALVDSSIAAGVTLGAVSDLDEFSRAGWLGASVEQYLGCTTTCPDLVAQASVVPHVGPGSAPVLAIHGAEDPWGTPGQGEAVRDAYRAAGIGDRFELVVIDEGPPDAQSHLPDLAAVIDDVRAFLGRATGRS